MMPAAMLSVGRNADVFILILYDSTPDCSLMTLRLLQVHTFAETVAARVT